MFCNHSQGVKATELIGEAAYEITIPPLPAHCPTAERLILPIANWPTNDRVQWEKTLAGEGTLEADNPAANWSDATIIKNREGYGRYLSWLARNDLLMADEDPAARITPDRLTSYVKDLKVGRAPASVGTFGASLCACANAFAPMADWDWLRRRVSRIRNRAKPSHEKQQAIRPTQEIYQLGLDIMEEARYSDRSPLRMAVRYEIGLIVALLALRPLRMRNLQGISLGSSLRYDGKSYWLTFESEDAKGRRPINKPFPNSLVPHLELYLKVFRRNLLRMKGRTDEAQAHRRLWIDQYGGPMQVPALRFNIKAVTKAAFGTAIWPHLFRDCAFTTLAIERPEDLWAGTEMLDHLSQATGEKHYNQATMLQASLAYTNNIIEQRTAYIDEILAAQAEEAAWVAQQHSGSAAAADPPAPSSFTK